MRQLLVRIAMKLGVYKWCVDVDTNLRERRIARAFRKYGLETMREADKAVSSFGGHLILYYGTLLGAIREHGFIPHAILWFRVCGRCNCMSYRPRGLSTGRKYPSDSLCT